MCAVISTRSLLPSASAVLYRAVWVWMRVWACVCVRVVDSEECVPPFPVSGLVADRRGPGSGGCGYSHTV